MKAATDPAKPPPAGRRIKGVVAYDGTAYAGWQVQPGQVTVQGEIERVILAITGESPRVNCSGRTDQGVHGLGQVVHFDLAARIPEWKLQLALNARLPPDIRFMAVSKAKSDFDARFSATGKEYRYFIWNGPVVPPHLRHFRYEVRPALDLDAMNAAGEVLTGKHDFAAFSANPGHEREGTVRIVHCLRARRAGPEVTIVARGNGFLYKMVRSLAGCLVRVGAGELSVADVERILHSRERTARVPSAPARGLFLWKVFYGRVPGAVQVA